MAAKEIIIYSTPTCVYCKMAKEFFQKHGVAYREYNVATDLEKRGEMFNKSHQMGVPVIDIGGEIFVGFNRPDIEKALAVQR